MTRSPKPVFGVIATLALIFTAQLASAHEKHDACVVPDIETPTMPSCVVQSHHGRLYIPKRYWMYPTFYKYGLAPFTIQSFGRVYINKSGRIVVRDVAIMDNAPDEFHHGLVRIVREGKWGYADSSGTIVVPMRYSCALNYQDSYSDIGPLVCTGCRAEKQGEYTACTGGQWYRTDLHGKLTPSSGPQ